MKLYVSLVFVTARYTRYITLDTYFPDCGKIFSIIRIRALKSLNYRVSSMSKKFEILIRYKNIDFGAVTELEYRQLSCVNMHEAFSIQISFLLQLSKFLKKNENIS